MPAAPTPPGASPPPSRQGLVELLLVAAFLLLAAGGAVAIFCGELRQAFGLPAAGAPAGRPGAR